MKNQMGRSTTTMTTKDAQALLHSLGAAYAATPTNLNIIDVYIVFAALTAVIQPLHLDDAVRKKLTFKTDYIEEFIKVVYMAIVGSFPFNSFLSGVLSCVGTAVIAVSLRIQVNKENKEFKDVPPERAFADFVLCNLVFQLVIMNFLG